MFSKIFRFKQKKQLKKVHVSDSDDDYWLEDFHLIERGLPCLKRSQIRLLVYKDHDKRGDKFVLFDSKTDVQDDTTDKQGNGGGRPARKRVSPDVQLFGEMIFGSVEMTYKGPTVKAHSIRTPPQLLLTKVFALKPPRALHHGGSHTSSHSNMSNSLSEYSSSVCLSESISSVSSFTSPVTSSDNEESTIVAKSVPVSSNVVSFPRSIQLQNIAEGFSNSTSVSSVDTSRSLTFPRTSSSSYQRRWLRSQETRMEYGCRRRNEYFSEEMSMRLRRRPKIGIGILFSLWEGKSTSEENNRLFQNFVFSHFPLFESHVHRLKRMVEKALLSSVQMSGKSFQDALLNAANTFATNILNLYYAPRIRNPVWLTMLSQPDQCNTICDDFVPQLVNAIELYNTKQTNHFLSSLLTAVMTYHVAWVTTVTPSSDVARRAYLDKHLSESLNVLGESHPYNPLWAQLSELYGACGAPAKMARTVIIGQDQQIVTIILHILSYFIRCSEVFEQPLEQSPKNLNSYLKSLETQLEADEIDTQVKSRCDTISENSDDLSTGSVRSNKESKFGKNSQVLSQNSKSYLRDAEMASENLVANSTDDFEKCEVVSHCPEINLENSNCSETKLTVENVDSCGEDSGICSIDLDSSVEIPKNDVKNCVNCGFQECEKEPKNSVENSENCSQNSENCSQNSTICTTDAENFLQDSNNCVNDSINSTPDSGRCSQNSENCVQNSTSSGRDLETSIKDGKYISKKCEKCFENCQNCTENSREKIQQKSRSNSKDKLCEECDNLTIPVPNRTSCGVILERNTELCNCNGVFNGHSKEHKLWKSFLRTSCCHKDSRNLTRRCLSANSVDENVNSRTKLTRRYSSEKGSDYDSGSKLCVQNDGKILSLDRQSILDMFLTSYPLCPVCKGQLNFVDQDFVKDPKILRSPSSGCLCQDCEKVKSCACQVVDTDLDKNERCASSITVNSDDYSSGISLQSSEAERCSLSSLSVDSDLNEQCLLSSENLVDNEDQAFTLELPEAQLDENFTEDDMSCKNSQDCQLFSFGRSLMAGYCDQYVPDFVLHGTVHCTEEQVKQSMQISLEQPVVDSPISESVIITGDTNKWECTIKTLPKQRRSIGNHPSGVRVKKVERSTLVHNFLTSFCDLWELNMPASFCLMHLEDKMKELYLRSKVVSEYLLTQKYVTMRDLMSTFGY
ncbi:folliculin-interacting 1 isoform X3, partial [Paramuricea clavata]